MSDRMEELVAKVERGERIAPEEALRLFAWDDIHSLGRLANAIRERKNGAYAYYVKNMHLNYTNVCVHACKFCGFARKLNETEGAWQMDLEQVLAQAESAAAQNLTEVHIVGGLNPRYPYEFYPAMLRKIRDRYPKLHIKAFTATEIDFISKIGKRSWESTLRDLQAAGLNSLPGGGAEVFSKRVWDEICDRKTSPEKWLQIHELAHRLGLRSTATLLYGHVETIEERVEHMRLLRDLQDRTGGFTAFIPIAFQPERNDLAHLGRTTALDDLRTHAVARIFLDNFEHVKAYWVTLGPKMAQVMMSFGADDIDGMIVVERIMHMSGAAVPNGLQEEKLVHILREAGRIPVQRDSVYSPVQVWN
jgi:aminodeoxyfutalosine synthase